MNYRNIRISGLFLLTILTLSTARGQLSSSVIDALVVDAMDKFGVAGVAVGIVKDGALIHTKGYGVKSINTNQPVDEHTNFAIASNSKAFTTTALAMLVEEGKFSWTDKVKDHIPEFKMYNAYVTDNFNIQDLLTHRSGLGLGAGDLMFFPDGSDFTFADLMPAFQHLEPQSAFRTKFDYDNLLYFVAGEIIARISGMTWETFIATRIMAPLGMDQSYPSLANIEDMSNIAAPHADDSGVLVQIPHFKEMINGAAGGIYANVDDLSQWMLVHLNSGMYGDSLVLFSEDSQREMWKIHTTLNTGRSPRYNTHFAGYGLGWGLKDVLGNMQVSHTGGLPGMLSKTVLIPDINLGIVVLTNSSNGGGALFGAVSQTILDSYLGLDDYGWVDRYHKGYLGNQSSADEVTEKVWGVVAAADDSHLIKADYLGIYKDPWFGKVEVMMKGDQLWFKSHRSPKLNGPMSFYKSNTFAIKWEYQDMNADAFAIFSLDKDGRAERIRMEGISPNIDFSFDFQDLDLRRVDE